MIVFLVTELVTASMGCEAGIPFEPGFFGVLNGALSRHDGERRRKVMD